MVRHRKGSKRRFNLRKVRTVPIITLGTLANVTVITGSVTGPADGSYRAMSHHGVWQKKNGTAGEGPIVVGYADGDYSVTEIKECLEATASISRGDKIANERANRFVRVIGSFSGIAAEEVLNDGKPIKTRLNWPFPADDTNLVIFAYNESGSALTTGCLIEADGNLWVKDT